jgi:TusA-related sulfurtransferase
VEKQVLDTTGFGRLDVVTFMEVKAEAMRPGEILEVVGDCPDFKEVVLDCYNLRNIPHIFSYCYKNLVELSSYRTLHIFI